MGSFGSCGSGEVITWHHHRDNEKKKKSYLVSKTLLLQVEARGSGNGGTLSSGREERSPSRESSLHGGEGGSKLRKRKEQGSYSAHKLPEQQAN